MNRTFWVIPVLMAAAVSLGAFAAHGEEFNDPHWNESPIHFSGGFHFGMGFAVDDTMKEVYGEKGVPYYAMEFGWKMVHQLELHAEMAYWWDQGRGVAGDGKKTNEKYKIHMAPAELGLLYRFNFTYDQIVVPYIGASGIYSYFLEERLESSWKKRGAKFGAAGKAGLMFLLDNIEKRASGALERDWGINNTYFVYHYKYSYLNDFDSDEGLDLTNHQHTFGVLFEF